MRGCYRCRFFSLIFRTCYCPIFSITWKWTHAVTLTTMERKESRRFTSTSSTMTKLEHMSGHDAHATHTRRTHDAHTTHTRLAGPYFPSKDQAGKRRRGSSTHVWRRSCGCTRENQLWASVTRHAVSKPDNATDVLLIHDCLADHSSFCCRRWYVRKQSDGPDLFIYSHGNMLYCTLSNVPAGVGYSPTFLLGMRIKLYRHRHNQTAQLDTCREYIQRFLQSSSARATFPLSE